MTSQTSTARPALALSKSRRPGLLARLLCWQAVARERRRLAELDPHLLDDIGLEAGAARQEAARPFWDSPRLSR